MADSFNTADVAPPPPPREIHPAKTHLAQCVDVINLGTEPQTYQGQDKGLVPKGAFVFRTGKLDSQGRPLDISIEFSVMTGAKANLRKICESWTGTVYTEAYPDIALGDFAGMPAMLTIVHQKSENTGNTYAKIAAVAAPPEGTVIPDYRSGYERAPYWEARKKDYAEKSAAYLAKKQPSKPTGGNDAPPMSWDDFPPPQEPEGDEDFAF